MLLKNTLITSVFLSLSACAWLQQPAAPVVSGTEQGTYQTSGASTNPYGATPYQNQSMVQPYTPPSTNVAPSSTYTPSYAPVDINAATHTVVRGDTVYNISKRYHISQDDLRAWNQIVDNNISVGQVLRVKPAGYIAPVASKPTVSQPTAPAANTTTATKPSTPAAVQTPVQTSESKTVAGIVWQRPVKGKGNIITTFGGNSKGVDIAGSAGQAVSAAADGKVVYAGSGLRGYGNLVIVQHTAQYLTAYGHNQDILVKEGQQVKRGQTIARMGNSDADRVKLHFELRKDGKPINPNDYIPF